VEKKRGKKRREKEKERKKEKKERVVKKEKKDRENEREGNLFGIQGEKDKLFYRSKEDILLDVVENN
jgi:hypothetical protein